MHGHHEGAAGRWRVAFDRSGRFSAFAEPDDSRPLEAVDQQRDGAIRGAGPYRADR